MNKISKSQYINYSILSDAANLFMRLVADLQSYHQFLQRVGDTAKLVELNNLLEQFNSAAHVSYLETLEDDVKE